MRSRRRLATLKIFGLVALVGALVLTTGTKPQPAQAAFPGKNGKIGFSTDRDANFEVYVMNADGTGQSNLTNNPATELSPAWSPDPWSEGDLSNIAFSSARDGNSEIYVMNADGSGQTRLTNDVALDLQPAWSPDGSKIAFTTARDGNWEVYVMNADGSGQTNLTNDTAFDVGPKWFPAGSKIAFQSDRDGNEEIYVMNADGRGATRLTYDPGSDREPAPSPDAARIAFSTNRDGNWEIYVMNADGSGQTRLTNNPAVDDAADWQPVSGYPFPPAPRTDFRGTGSTTSIEWCWGPSSVATGARVYDNSGASVSPLLSPDPVCWSETGLQPGGICYTRHVHTLNNAGLSFHSNNATVCTSPPPPSAPTAPTNFHGHGSTTSIEWCWNQSGVNTTGFQVEDAGGVNLSSTLSSSARCWTEAGLQSGGSCYARHAHAVNDVGLSGPSNTANVCTAPPPTPPPGPVGGLPEWEFNNPGSTEGWTDNNTETSGVACYPDPAVCGFFIDPEARDPWITSPELDVDADALKTIEVRMATNAKQNFAAIRFITEDDQTWDDDTKRVQFPVSNDFCSESAPWKIYKVFMGSKDAWTGTVTQIRIDPSDAPAPTYDDGITFDDCDTVGFDSVSFESGRLIVLVHGWGGNCDSMAELKSYLERKPGPGYIGGGVKVECFDPLGDGRGYNYKLGAKTAASQLAAFILQRKKDLRLEISDRNVDIVAHSFGGLVSRHYIEKLTGSDHVRSLTMLGTPNNGVRGSGLAFAGSAVLVESLLPLGPDFALEDMAENSAFLSELNATPWSPPPVAYQVIAGTADSSFIYLGSLGNADNDCLVTLESAAGPSPGIPLTPTLAIHAGGPFWALCPSNRGVPGLLDQAGPTFLYVFAALRDADAARPPYLGPSAAGLAVPQEAAQQPEGSSLAALASGIVQPLGVVQHTAVLEAGVGRAAFSVVSPAGQSLVLSFIRPDGTPVDEADPDVSLIDLNSVPEFGLSGQQVLITDPAPGIWTVQVSGELLSSEYPFSFAALADAPVTFSARAEPALALEGSPVAVFAQLDDSGKPLAGATASASIRRPDGTEDTVALVDDGTGSDIAADDGIYSGALPDVGQCGTYLIQTSAAGTASGGAFTRSSWASTTLIVPGDGVGDACNPDEDGDGLSDEAELGSYGTNPLLADTDGDGLSDSEEILTHATDPLLADTDGDSCIDGVELGADQTVGGLRDPLVFWDFMSVFTGNPLVRDTTVSVGDISAVVGRFGANDTGPGTFDRDSYPLSVPNKATGDARADYHPSYDRGGSDPEANVWNLLPPDGAISVGDISATVNQFGHSCL